MEPTHIVTVILGVSLLYFGTAMFKHYVDTRSKERMERDRSDQLKSMMSGIVELKKEEVRIVEAVSSLAKAEPVLQELKELSDTMHGRLVKAAGLSDAGTVQGVTMDGDAAKELARNPRHEPVERTLYWNCTVQKVDASKPDRFTVRLLGEGNSAPVDTEIPDTELNDDLKRTIQKAEWSRQLLRVVILARYINDKLDKAELIGAEEIRPDKPGPDSDPVVAS